MQRLTRQTTDGFHWVGILWPLALLAPFVPGLPRPTNSGLTWRQEVIVAALVSLTLVALWRRARSAAVPRTCFSLFEFTLFAPLGAFVAWSALSLAWAVNEFAAFHYATTWGLYLLFFLLVSRAAARPRLLRASITLLASVVLIISAANIVGHLTTPNSLLRQHGLGEPIAVTIPFFLAIALKLRRTRAALLCGAASVAAWLAVLQIAERASFVAVGVGLLVLAACMIGSKRFRPHSARRALVLGFAFAACLALQVAPSPFEQSAHQHIFARIGETSAVEKNTQARFLYWAAAIEMWRARPFAGVGAGGYESAMPAARAALAEKHPESPLVELNEKFLTGAAHNEYLQILAETGAVGFALFIAFCAALVWAAWRALRHSRGPLAPGAVASLAVFAVSSGASSISFRWMGSGLVFFFAAALVLRLARQTQRGDGRELEHDARSILFPRAVARRAWAFAFVFSFSAMSVFCVQASNIILVARAQGAARPAAQEKLFAAALRLNPYDPATRYNFGIRLHFLKREADALPQLRFALARGFNTSTCYAYLAGAEEATGDLATAERTLAEAVRVYPRSVFLRVRHAAALERAGRAAEAEAEMSVALELDPRMARGWQQLIYHDIDAAIVAARRDAGIALPGQLYPEDAVFAVLHENERRFPAAVSSGWRAHVRNVLAR